jgi:hypothetical protein
VADDRGGRRAQRAEDGDIVGDVREHAVRLDRRRDQRVPVAAQVDRHRSVAGGSERRQLVPPRAPALGKAVKEQDEGTFPLLDEVDPATGHLDLAVNGRSDIGHGHGG